MLDLASSRPVLDSSALGQRQPNRIILCQTLRREVPMFSVFPSSSELGQLFARTLTRTQERIVAVRSLVISCILHGVRQCHEALCGEAIPYIFCLKSSADQFLILLLS